LLDDGVDHFKPGSPFECAPELGSRCGQHLDNVKSHMNSIALSRWAYSCTALATVLCSACVPMSPLPERALHGPTVTLPLAMAGIKDARQPFATLFDKERLNSANTGGLSAAEWLHGVPAKPLEGVDSLPAIESRFAERAPSTSVLIVPGLFGDCLESQSVPFGDGVPRTRSASMTEAYRQYDDLHLLSIRAVSLPGRTSSSANGRRVADAIRAESARPGVRRIVLVAFSKGVPDTLHALAQLQAEGGVPPQVMALVSVAGVVMGTPIADQYDSAFGALSPLFQPLDCSPSDGREVSSLTRRERVAWLAANPPPSSLRYYSLVAFATHDEIAPGLRPVHSALSRFDLRNDGQLYTSDAILPGSTLLAEARADHWDVALPRDRHPSRAIRALSSGRGYPREALFRATIKWVVGSGP
jgi:hypothetical protein